MNFLLNSSMIPSTRCSSEPVPRAVVTSAWVSPRWKRAEPWALGRRSDLAVDRPDVLRSAAIGAIAVEDHLADDPLLQRVEGGLDLQRRGHPLVPLGAFGDHLGEDPFLKLLDGLVPLGLDERLLCLA